MPVMPFSVNFKKRKRALNVPPPSPVPVPLPVPVPPPRQLTATPQAGPSYAHPASDTTLITPSPLRAALAYSDPDPVDDYTYNNVEELADEHVYPVMFTDEFGTAPEFEDDGEYDQIGDEDILSRLLHREREYTRLQVYYEELHKRYANSKDQIEHLNRQVDALSARIERKEHRIRLLKVLAIRR
ncbi:uncharacterized protein CcaverHIS019_0211830 [Cutaneotrichosporon cavernicola]|uniref:Uncharacterized protein n=1 Tax=Cutaneotrichosporon cavernicola TaxID=279322 RepID=A0AA48IEL1_9TREE|nr:uncharacterized protein CcaverHIS019_0211830 [Cutaneotrichosporon cavernicola]BEI89821.1 hypothetical protein CcaverHIS019_0211830 [Cutaneotrichosporon cavernicola]BEI97591.1 hypothetical protein CcaverHIS631_0211800 [Cutaneotrichosporon cavernicola]BEJ05370.1 hypothetical protein CcaverHIS641_0211870 [Cutaneotrichosporon cavernicola]